MDAATLILKLIEIEREVGKQVSPAVHSMLIDAQRCAVQLHRDRMAILKENLKLRGALLTTWYAMPHPSQPASLNSPQAV